jgi:hypothetical protein
MIEPVAVAVLAKAPLPGFAKTRLIPLLGPERAARLQAQLIVRAVATASAAAIGPVTVWAAPDAAHACFRALAARGIALACQCDGDLGQRMLTAIAAADGPALVIGTDCPALTAEHLGLAADALRGGRDVVVCPAEDGGYVLIGMRSPHSELFEDMPWSSADVLAETRRRLRRHRLAWLEPVTLWDLDRPEDLPRLREIGLAELIAQ